MEMEGDGHCLDPIVETIGSAGGLGIFHPQDCAQRCVQVNADFDRGGLSGGCASIESLGEKRPPHWRELVPARSGGRITAQLQTQSERNLSGTEIIRLVRSG
jgi:hypothetical protein